MKQDEEPTTEVYIPLVLERADCGKHHGLGPCWTVMLDNGDILRGVCNQRARAAGFVGKISDQSLSRFGGVTPRPKRHNTHKK